MDLRPHHIGLVVNDLEKTTAFYHALGFETVQELYNDDDSRAIRFLELGGFRLELFWYAETPVSAVPSGRAIGYRHLALRTYDMDETFATLKAKGLLPDDAAIRDAPAGFRLLFFRDPDGLEVEIMQEA